MTISIYDQVVDLLNAGQSREFIMEMLGIDQRQYANARKRAILYGLLIGSESLSGRVPRVRVITWPDMPVDAFQDDPRVPVREPFKNMAQLMADDRAQRLINPRAA